jgi:hypothetical protein
MRPLPRARRRGASGGVGGGASSERIPRDKPPNLARRALIATKTQELRPALSCGPLPNHVLPLAHFGATSGVYDGERSGSTQHYDLKAHHAPVGGGW